MLGLIDFVSSKKRGECTKYRILYPTNYSTKEGTRDGSKEVQTLVQSTDINKQKTKTKTKNSLSFQVVEKRDKGDSLPRSHDRFQNFEQRKTDYDALALLQVRARLSQPAALCEEA